ncbi:protein S100-A16 [Amia ocellicauda]|uniref:protein S100-A16 n=1 Tax=Amia ocellicauda TaxID=2972642 RepID=UPI0034641AC3|nr:S10AG protein [Amia calva]
MESAIMTIVKVFQSASKGRDSMGGKDFQKMVHSQLGNILTDTDSKKAVNEMKEGLDDNKDGKVSFPEFMTLIGYIANTLSEQRSAATQQPETQG